jgi:hypothetical protein
METKLIRKLSLIATVVFSTTFVVIAQQKEKLLSTDIFLDGKQIYRNYPKGDSSYKDWDKDAKVISSYIDEDDLTLYEDKIKDSILFRKGTNNKYNYIEFWWFQLLSSKHSIYIKSKDMSIHVGDDVSTLKILFPNMWKQYTEFIKADEKNCLREKQLYTSLLFHFYENSKDLSDGSFQVYVKNKIIIKITINFMLEGDMP